MEDAKTTGGIWRGGGARRRRDLIKFRRTDGDIVRGEGGDGFIPDGRRGDDMMRL